MPNRVQRELIVFPTELALRRFQQEQALAHGWVDASCHTTFARLRQLCLPYTKASFQRMTPAKALLMRKQVVEVARGHFVDGGPLGELSEAALAGVLDQLVGELALLPEESPRIVDWMLNRSPRHKLYQLGVLYSVWRATLQQDGFADPLDVNSAMLKLLKGNRQNWPPLLRDANRLVFRSVRWFNPFEESCVAALNQRLNLRIESALPAAHAEKAEDRLGQRIRSEIMGEPWAVWAEDLGDALAVDSPDVLQFDNAARIAFSRSAGAYGEIEDLARRICWHIQSGGVAPNRIALVVPNLGTVQDIVPHVFGRFRIPYYFRRGRPVLSSPCVKAFLAWLAFPLRPERDALIDLLRNPAIQFENRDATVEHLLAMPPRLPPEQVGPAARSGKHAAEMLKARIVQPGDHFNAEALAALSAALESFGDHPLPLHDLIDLLEELMENETVRPRESHEQGVWILNPHDAVGLDFDIVVVAGLNEGEFPGVPQQDALLSDKERASLRLQLESEGRRLPKLALASSDVGFEQDSVRFLSALGMAREQLVLSYQAVDQDGNERGQGEYYRKLWSLAGWAAQDEIALHPYDQWRIGQLGADCIFADHWSRQRSADPEERVPMPGESFLPIVPLPLCRATDEAMQAAVQLDGGAGMPAPRAEQGSVPAAPVGQVVAMLKIEAERAAFVDAPVAERAASVYCGHIPALRERIVGWFDGKRELSPTALETLARCRYAFLLEKIFGVRDPRVADDTPDPMDRGTLIHSILKEIYAAIANGESGVDAPRCWAVKASGGWRRRNEGGPGSIPLAVVRPEHVAFARGVAEHRLGEAQLGHPGVWAAEREKVLEMVLNFVRHDAETCAAENRYPAMFEVKFGGDAAVVLDEIRLHGIIDRVDLVFDEAGALKTVRVLDYKGPGRALGSLEEYIDEIRRNLDCQLPVYAFAAQQVFFGRCNAERANAMTEAGYLFYQREAGEVGKALRKGLVPMDAPGLLEGFMDTLRENLRRLKAGDFAVDPLIESYTDFQSVCRVETVSRDELD